MFVLITVKDTIPVPATVSGLPGKVTIMDAINKKYANKLIPDKGLAIACFDILSAEDGKVTWGNGMMYYKVAFRLMLFAPFHQEIMLARVIETTPQWVRLSVDFFQDIYIPASLLPPNSVFDIKEGEFFWYHADDEADESGANGDADTNSNEDAEPPTLTPQALLNTRVETRYYIQAGHAVRLRVNSLEWQDVRPVPIGAARAAAAQLGRTITAGEIEGAEKTPYERAAFKVIGSISEVGMGVTSWWA